MKMIWFCFHLLVLYSIGQLQSYKAVNSFMLMDVYALALLCHGSFGNKQMNSLLYKTQKQNAR